MKNLSLCKHKKQEVNPMKFKRIITAFMGCCILMQSICAFAYNEDPLFLREKHFAFASQYDYHEGDFDKSFNEYPGITYTSGVEYREDGTAFECPAIYVDEHAMQFNSYNLKKGEAKFIINGTANSYFDQCVLYNSRLLVPANAFKEVGCTVDFNEDSYVLTISKDGTILEILPCLIGMRKNQANGFYVPLEVGARFIDNTVYVPVRAVADEFDLTVNWDAAAFTVTLENNS